MKYLRYLCAALVVVWPSLGWADALIPALSAAGASTGADFFPVSQAGGDATKQTVTALFATPPAMGGTTPAAGHFTTLSATSTISGAGFSTYLASPPAIGGTVPAAGNFTTGGFTGATTFGAGITATGLSAGTQVSCLGLDSGNNFVLNAAACGSGAGGSWTLTDGTHTITGVTQVTVTGGVVGGTTPNATLSITASAGGSANQIQYNNAGALGGFTMSGDATLVVGTGVITVTKTSGVAFAAVATSGSATDLTTGTLPAARLPNPTASTLGGVESLAAVTSNWIRQISTSGVPSASQPAFTDISGVATFAQLTNIATNTIYGNSSGSTAAPSAQTIGAGLVMNANGLQTIVGDVTKSANYTVAAGDMSGLINLTGTATLTIPAISSTVLTTNMSASYQNQGSGNWTISSTPTINGLNSTTVPPGGFGTFVGNGTTLDFTGLSTPTASAIGGVMSKDCTSGGQFIQKINTDGTETCATPAGGGNVSTAGTLPVHTVVIGGGSQAVVATATGASGIALIGQGGSADPVFGTVVVAGGGTGATTLTAHGVLLGEGTGAIAATAVMTDGQLLVGQSAADPLPKTPSGDCTMAATGALTCFATPATVAKGGTGVGTLAAHGVLVGEGTSNVALVGPSSTSGALFASAGSSSDPAFDTNAVVVAGALSLGASGTAGSVAMGNATSGVLTLQPQTGALGTVTVSIPAATDTLVNLTGTQTLTNKTLTTAALGSSTATTQAAKDNSTKVATTAYVDATTGLTTGTSVTLTGPRQYFVCTGTCTVTMPVPAAGMEFCVRNDDNVATVITFAAIGSSARYEKTAFTSYGTAGTGTAVSGGAAGDKMCWLGLDSTHYLVASFNGVWTMN